MLFKKIFVLCSIFWVSTSSYCQFSPGYFAIRDVHLIDGMTNEVLRHHTIVIKNEKIVAVGPTSKILIPDSVPVMNFSGKYVIPGLIDAHVHMSSDPSGIDNRARAEKDLHAMLLSGITTVRDMAGDARALASISRDAMTGDIVSPDIFYAALLAGPTFFKDPRTIESTKGGMPGNMPYMKSVTDSTNIELTVAAAKGTGATAIKLYAEISGQLAKKISTEAHAQQIQVWSHADLTIASPLEVIQAGVNSISHAGMLAKWPFNKIPDAWKVKGLTENFWDSVFNTLPVNDYISAMLANKTILDPTLLVYKNRLEDPSISEKVRANTLAQWNIAKRFTKLAIEKGVPVCTGTDTDDNKFVQREMKLFVQEIGITPIQAIISATKIGAMAIGIENITGTIEVGKLANLVVLSDNPASDINNIDKVTLVIKNGKLINVKSH